MSGPEAYAEAVKRVRAAETSMRENLPELAAHQRETALIYATLALAEAQR